MIPLFIGITAFNILSLLVVGAFGYAVSSGRDDFRTLHQLSGVLATIACVAVHCIVFTYFMATSKWINHAIDLKKLDPTLANPTRSFRRQAFPAALIAMFSVFGSAILGAATFNGYVVSPSIHLISAYIALIINIIVAGIEYNAVRRNGLLVDEILKQVKQKENEYGQEADGRGNRGEDWIADSARQAPNIGNA